MKNKVNLKDIPTITYHPPKLKEGCEHDIVEMQMGAAIINSYDATTDVVHGQADVGEKCLKCGGHTGKYRIDKF